MRQDALGMRFFFAWLVFEFLTLFVTHSYLMFILHPPSVHRRYHYQSLYFARLGPGPWHISPFSSDTFPYTFSASSNLLGPQVSCKSCVPFCAPPQLSTRL